MRWARAAAFAAALVVGMGAASGLTGCSNDDSLVPVDSNAGTVGAGGGTVLTADGDGVTIPGGALATDITVTVTATPSAPTPSNTTLVGAPYTFGPEGQTFLSPVTVTLVFDPTLLPKGKTANDVVIYTAPAGTTNYAPLATSILSATQASAQTTHFSVFVCVVPDVVASEDAGAPGDDGGIVITTDAGGNDATVQNDAASDATLGGDDGSTAPDSSSGQLDANGFTYDAAFDAAPEPPVSQDASATNVITQHNFVIHTMHLGDEIDPVSGEATWPEYGYDIDGKVTTAASTDVCTLAANASTKNQTDGVAGIDNSFGENIVPILSALEANVSASQDTSIAAGATALMLDITGLDETNHAQTATGLQGQLFGGVHFGQGPNASSAVPTFTTADNWPVDPSFVASDIADGGLLATPAVSNEVFATPYIQGGTFVGQTSSVTLTLLISGSPLVLPIHHATITFVNDGAQAASGIISGVILTTDLVNAFASIAGNISSSFCPGTATFTTLTTSIQQAADIMHDGTNVAGTACDAISIGLGFTADEIGLPRVVGVPATVTNPCADAGQ